MKKHQSILQINKKIAKTFEGDPIISFKRTRNPREIIDGNTIINKVKRTAKENMEGKLSLCKGRKNCVFERIRPL